MPHSAIFAIEVCAHAILENHYHTVLRTRPDIVALGSDREVATRWLTLFPHHRDKSGTPMPPREEEICALADRTERIAQLRRRLSSLSWFNGRLNEFIARVANKEDQVKGRFWESRFKCQALLDEAAIAGCMVYVDLNLIRAGLADAPEESDFTSIQERIRAWHEATMSTASATGNEAKDVQSVSISGGAPISEVTAEISALPHPFDTAALSAAWLCPIQSDSRRRGILSMTAVEYFDLVDKSGRMTRSDKRGAIEADLAPILLRIGAKPEAWLDTTSRFGSRFRLAAGMLSHLRSFADQIGRHWLKGVASARASFASSPPQLA